MSRQDSDEPRLFDTSPVYGEAAAVPQRMTDSTPSISPRLCVLGSGSGGNSSVVSYNGSAMLIDAGFGPVTIARRLQQAGLRIDDVSAICLTHLDQDHFRPTLVPMLRGFGVRVYLHRWHAEHLAAIEGAQELFDAGLVFTFENEPFEPVKGVAVQAVRLAHDSKGTSGFHLSAGRGRIVYATDLGHVPDELIQRMVGVDVLAIECNYDPPMQLRSNRPLFLKRRIMGHAGHLSNEQAFEAVRRAVDLSPAGPPRHVILLHRSQQCNDPAIVRDIFARDQRFADRVTLTEQRRRSRWFDASPDDVATARHPTLPF